MKRFQQKQAYKKLLYSPVVISGLLVICILVTIAAIGMYQKSREARANKLQAQAEYNALMAQEANLESGISKLETTEGIEENLREKYRVGKEGEHLVVITTDAGNKKIAEEQLAEMAKESWWMKVKGFFGKIF
jgi:cell division protein FtsB